MDILASIIVIILFPAAAATAAAFLGEGRGHTPPAASHEDWSTLDPPSASYTLRIF